MLQLLATTQTAVVVRHWFEIDLEDASMEHGCRVELRRVWDEGLTRDPWRWLGDQVRRFGRGSSSQPAPLDADDAAELHGMADQIVSIGQQFSPEVCTSTEQCYGLTRDARGAVSLMVRYLKNPTALDNEIVSLWTEGQGG